MHLKKNTCDLEIIFICDFEIFKIKTSVERDLLSSTERKSLNMQKGILEVVAVYVGVPSRVRGFTPHKSQAWNN